MTRETQTRSSTTLLVLILSVRLGFLGYGRVNLDNVLLGVDNQQEYVMVMKDAVDEPLSTGQTFKACFDVQDAQDFKVSIQQPDCVIATHIMVE